MQEETVRYLSEFLVCEQEGCFQPVSICHKTYFRELHSDTVNGRRVPHKSMPFDQSLQFANFYAIGKLEDQVAGKIAAGLRGVAVSVETVVQTAIYTSPLFLQIFNNSAQAIGEYLYLRTIQKGQPAGRLLALSEALCTALLVNQDKKVGKAYREVCKESAEWEHLSAEFNQASGINSAQLERFIEVEAAHFAAYVGKVAQEGTEFSIEAYLQLRANSSAHETDPYYFGSEFTHFLTLKYGKRPEKQQLFDVAEYYLHFWEYFYVSISKNVSSYFEEEVGLYREYETAMATAGLRESLLSFRLWRLNRTPSAFKPSLRNPFFLDSYIFSFIEQLIYKKLYFPEEKRNYDFRQFAHHLKDYVKLVRDKQEQFSFNRYRQYSDFRNRNEKFQQGLTTNKDIIYDRNYFLEYVHNEFVEGNKLAGKKYKKHQELRKAEEEQKAAAFRQAADALKATLTNQQTTFYEIVFANYINFVQEEKETPTAEGYRHFKEQVLTSIDEAYLQEEEENYRLALQGEADQPPKQPKKEGKEEIVKQEINEIEEKIAEIIVDEERSEESEEQESEEEEVVICPCCKGRPYDCAEKECMVMGCCTTCMLD